MRRLVISVFCLLSVVGSSAQSVEQMDRIMAFYGADSPEDLDPYDVDNLCSFLSHPLALNCVRASSLADSGLFTPYQAASLADYRNRHGDVLSFEELAGVDGFGQAFVRNLAPFVSLVSLRQVGMSVPDTLRFRNSLSMRTALKNNSQTTYGVRYKVRAGEALEAGAAFSRTSEADGKGPDALSGYLMWCFRKCQGKVLLGDFNARFGQGLSLWNGMSVGGLTSPASFLKRTSGITASASFTGNYANRGLAAEIVLGKVRASALLCAEGDKSSTSMLPAANVAMFLPSGVISLTHYTDFSLSAKKQSTFEMPLSIPDMKTAADFAFCLQGVDVFSEISYDWVNHAAAALSGVVFPAGEDVQMAAMLRCYPSRYNPSRSAAARSTTRCSNECGASFSAEFPSLIISADAAYFPMAKPSDDTPSSAQLKLQAEWKMVKKDHLQIKLRCSERLRSWGTAARTELRADLSYVSRCWNANLRLNAVKAAGLGLLSYSEGGYKSDDLSVWLRCGIFCIDDWEDRIYVYERDAPGSFNVPSYYGRGLWGAVTAGWRCASRARLYFRSGFTAYPFMKSKKSGRAELKLQFVCDF